MPLSEVGESVCVLYDMTHFIRINFCHCGALIMWGSVLWAYPAGEDPLAERTCDLDSVAGVLKLYFRGLENPLFPIDSTSQLLEHTRE